MRISVVIPCYDAEDWLATTLRSVLRQTLPPDEILVVDNGSRDASVAVAEGFAAPVRVLHEPRKGAAAARETGAAAATGDAIMFLDADDLLGPTVLQALAEALAREPEGIAVAPWRRLEPDGDRWLVAPPSCPPRRPGQDVLSAWLTGWYHPPCSMLWSWPAYRAGGGWDPQVAVNQDGDLAMRALIAGARLVETREGCAYYRRLPDAGASVSGKRATRAGLESRLFVLERIARLLRERGRERAYRGALAEAFDLIAEDARPDHPDLAERARAGRPRRALKPLRAPRILRNRGAFAVGPIEGRPTPDIVPASDAAADDTSPDGSAPLVSVVIPAFNRERLIVRALDSVLAQTYESLEVLVVDDASTDGTAAAVEGYADPRVRLVRQETNAGVAAARNSGMRESGGALIALLDSDDAWRADKIEKQLACFAARPRRLGLVYTGIENRLSGGGRSEFRPTARGFVFERMLLKNELHGGPSSVLMRREVFDTVGGFDTRMPAIEDHEWFTRALRLFEVECIAEPLAIYFDEDAEVDGGVRRSRNFAANMAAREQFRRRYHYDMRAAGIEHRHLIESVDRHLASPFGDRRAAAGLALRALKRRPASPAYWRRLARCAVPRGTGQRLRGLLGEKGRKPGNARSPA